VRVRSTIVRGDPGCLDEGIIYLRDEVLPAMQEMDGFVGLSALAERLTGRCIATSAWTDERDMQAGDAQIRVLRAGMERRFGGQADGQEWQVALVHRRQTAAPGACARVTWARTVHEPMEGFVHAYRAILMPRLELLPGFSSLSLVVDRRTGRSSAVESFESRAALERSRGDARALREEFSTAMGARVTEVAEMDLVLAHLRVPETG
jgi:hypothetical protein